jgi:hypothetical protein
MGYNALGHLYTERIIMELSSEDWARYLTKYDKLMWMISKRISGDLMTASVEDNYSDLCVAALESVKAFNVKTGNSFDEMMSNKLFDQYTKTVLWNRKNKNGKRLTQRMPFINKIKSIDVLGVDEDTPFDIEDSKINFSLSSIILDDIFKDIDSDSKKVLNAISMDSSVVSAEGKLKMLTLLRPTGLTPARAQTAVEKIEKILNKQYGVSNE